MQFRDQVTKTIVILIICCFCPFTVFGQRDLRAKDSVYFFWQPEQALSYSDYKGPWTSNGVHAELALWTALDLPQATEGLSPKQMRVYIAPVVNRYMSYADTNDAGLMAINTIYFDLLELSARAARVKLSNLPDSVMNKEALSKMFKAIVREMHENRLRMNRAFHKEMYRDKIEGALATWQQKLKQELFNTAKWATEPIECYRFLQNCPLEKGYTEDLNSNAEVLSSKFEMVLPRDTWHAEFCQISRWRK